MDLFSFLMLEAFFRCLVILGLKEHSNHILRVQSLKLIGSSSVHVSLVNCELFRWGTVRIFRAFSSRGFWREGLFIQFHAWEYEVFSVSILETRLEKGLEFQHPE